MDVDAVYGGEWMWMWMWLQSIGVREVDLCMNL